MPCLRFLGRAAILLMFLVSGFCLADDSGPLVPDATSLSGRGILALATGYSVCLQETHELTDPCTGVTTALLDGFVSTVRLDSYLCQHVSVTGPDVGVECPIIGVQALAIAPPPACSLEARSLLVFDPASTWLQWAAMPCAVSYDVIRGALPGPVAGPGTVDLGRVACLVNDLVVPPGSIPSTSFGPRDADTPPPGQAFFYLVRATDLPYGATLYGFSSAGEVEVPAAGDCAI